MRVPIRALPTLKLFPGNRIVRPHDKQSLLLIFLLRGTSLAEVVVIGDGVNDIPLPSDVGPAVAMQNAPSEIKAIADYITLDVDHSGLAAAVNKFLL